MLCTGKTKQMGNGQYRRIHKDNVLKELRWRSVSSNLFKVFSLSKIWIPNSYQRTPQYLSTDHLLEV